MRLRFPLVLIAALSAFAVPASSAFASVGTFVSPTASATISHNQTLKVDTTGVTGAAGVDFYIDNAGTPGGYIGGYTIQQADPTSAQALPYSSNGSVDSYQVAIGGWDDGPITFDAVIVDSASQPLSTISRSVTINNSQDPLVQGSFFPSATGTKSGTIALSLTPIDQNNVITAGSFSVDGRDTTHPLTSDGSGHWSASVDTVALGVPNGALDIAIHLEDAAGNMSDTDIFYTVGNPQAPLISPNTLVADKSLYRTDETSLEVGDIVEAYGMQATGYPVPTLHYLWNVCRGPFNQTCTGTTPGQDGSYTVQAGDEGATLTLVATASNGVNPGAFTLVEFGVIAAAYVAPFDNDAGDGPQSGDPVDPTPTPAPPVVTPPVVIPPVVIPPVVVAPVVTPAEQKVINIAQKTVTTEKTAVVKAEQKVAAAKRTLAVALKALATGTATASEKAAVVAARAALASKAAAEKAMTKKLVIAQKQLAAKRAAALKP